MSERLTNVQVQNFLQDVKDTSETIILEEGSKQKAELLDSARKRGIIISKDDRDLGVIKTIYCFTSKANLNKARLPKEEFVKILPQIVGRPMNNGHDRKFILGFYIDYKYILKGEKAIAYSIFFKSVYPKLWEKAKDFQKKKLLSSSYEIWSPEEKRKELSDGTYELHDMAIAGGALIFEEYGDEPAFKDAKVLSISSKEVKDCIDDKCLVCASKYKSDEIITSAGEVVTKEKETIQVETPKVNTKIKCSNCSEEFDYNGVDVQVKCPKCFAILNKEGTMQYPPQIKDFTMLCPSCKTGRWLILSRKEDSAKLRCSQCAKEYNVTFEKAKVNEAISKISFVYTSTVSCPQCGKSIYIAGVSGMDSRMVKCKKCGLEFAYNIKDERYKRISKIEEVIPNKENKIDNKKESSEEGGNKMAKEKKVEKASEKKVEVKHDYLKSDEKTNIKVIHDLLEKSKVKDKKVEAKVEKKKEVKKEVKVKEEKKIEVKVETPKKVEPKVEKKEEAKETPKAEKTPKTTKKVEEPKAEEKPEVKKEEKFEEKPEAKAEVKEAPKAEEPKVEKKITDAEIVAPKKETPKEKAKVTIKDVKLTKTAEPTEARFEYEVDSLDETFEDVKIAQEKFNCSCVECGHKLTSTEHCATLKCPKCGGQMRRAERPGNGKPEDKAKRLTTKQRKALPDNMFAVVVKVKDKRTGKTRKIRMYPINDEAHVRNALARLGQPRPKATLKRLGVSIESVKAKILRRARQLKMTTLLERYKAGIRKIANKVKTLRKEKASLENKVKLYADNAKTIIERRTELGDTELTDADILNDDKFEKAKLEKENLLLKANEEKTDELVGSKKKDEDYYTKKHKKIDKYAFGKVNKAHKNKK